MERIVVFKKGEIVYRAHYLEVVDLVLSDVSNVSHVMVYFCCRMCDNTCSDCCYLYECCTVVLFTALASLVMLHQW